MSAEETKSTYGKNVEKKTKMTVSVLEFKKYKYLPQLFDWNFHN
jgi:hypothetical protein